MDPNDEKSFIFNKQDYQLISTLEENLKCLIPRKQKRSKNAQELHKVMETPTVDGLNETIQANLIKKHMLTIGNVNLATKAYDPDVGENEGNNMRSMLTPVVSNIVKITNELMEVQQDLTVSIDRLTDAGG